MYKIAICDDDCQYVQYLEELMKTASEDSDSFIFYRYYSGEKFLENLELDFDLVFLDMQMGNVNGITAALDFRKRNEESILVFCTGVQLPRPEFFDVQPFRYLMKNYSEEKLKKEIKTIISKMIDNKKEKFIIAPNDGKINKIAVNEITYISNLKRGCLIHVFSKKSNQCYEIASNKKLADAYEELKNNFFEYAHNSYIVNFRMIIGIKRDVITLEDLTNLNISRSKKGLFHSRFTEYLGEKYKRDR